MAEGRQRRILVVDDDQVNLEVAQGYLEAAGFQVIMAHNGTDGMAKAEREQPDLILLDVMMPHLTGFVVCRRLKSNAKTEKIPIVFLTGVDFEEARQKADECGAQGYLTKPIEMSSLVQTIEGLLSPS